MRTRRTDSRLRKRDAASSRALRDTRTGTRPSTSTRRPSRCVTLCAGGFPVPLPARTRYFGCGANGFVRLTHVWALASFRVGPERPRGSGGRKDLRADRSNGTVHAVPNRSPSGGAPTDFRPTESLGANAWRVEEPSRQRSRMGKARAAPKVPRPAFHSTPMVIGLKAALVRSNHVDHRRRGIVPRVTAWPGTEAARLGSRSRRPSLARCAGRRRRRSSRALPASVRWPGSPAADPASGPRRCGFPGS
jgi:hypothetical protein